MSEPKPSEYTTSVERAQADESTSDGERAKVTETPKHQERARMQNIHQNVEASQIMKNIVTVAVLVLLTVTAAAVLLYGIEVKNTRARIVLDCVVALRTGESLPAILVQADDMNEAALLWCDEFVDHGGRPEELPKLDQWD